MAVAPIPKRKSFFTHLLIGILTILVVFEAF
jgi:hypothetical protein